MANKDHRIKPLGDHGQPREAKGYRTWKPWRTPADWTRDEIAKLGHRPGVYLLRAITSANTPVEFQAMLGSGESGATPNDLAKRAASLQGVLYVGKAVDLNSRFGKLAVSWQSDPPTPAHTSAQNYLQKDWPFRQQFPANRVEITCMPIGSRDWTDKALANGLLGLPQEWFWGNYPHWTQGHGSAQMDQTVAAAIDSERSLLCLYRMVFGDFPPLNLDRPNCIGTKLDDDWLKSLLEHGADPAKSDPQADAAVEMGDPDSTEARKVIDAHRQKRKQSGNA